MKKLIVLSLLLLPIGAWACSNYEECQNECHQNKQWTDMTWDGLRACTDALNFKLDEISKKLDNPEKSYSIRSEKAPMKLFETLEDCLEVANLPVVYQKSIDYCYEKFRKVGDIYTCKETSRNHYYCGENIKPKDKPFFGKPNDK